MEDSVSYVGATIFWLYIVAALFFTALITYTLLTNGKSQAVDGQHRRRKVAVFSVLAVVSFGILSFNMLTVLIQSFNSWSETHPLFVTNSVLLDVWHWSLTSTLFRDFAEALVETDARYLWSEAALLATFAVSVFISIEGHRRKVPRLWAFYCLGQILEISFTQNLFHIALLQHESTEPPGKVPMRTLRLLRFLTAAYCGCLLVLPMAARTVWLMPLVLVTRLMLFIPLLLPLNGEAETDGEVEKTKSRKVRQEFKVQIVLSVAACILIQMYAAFSSGATVRSLFWTLFEHPAVSSLGCDTIISLASALIWGGMSSHVVHQSSKGETKQYGNKSHRRNPRKQRSA